MMPVCDGFHAAARIRSVESRRGWLPVPIVAYTSEDVRRGSPTWLQCMHAGFNDVVVRLPHATAARQRWCRCVQSLRDSHSEIHALAPNLAPSSAPSAPVFSPSPWTSSMRCSCSAAGCQTCAAASEATATAAARLRPRWAAPLQLGLARTAQAAVAARCQRAPHAVGPPVPVPPAALLAAAARTPRRSHQPAAAKPATLAYLDGASRAPGRRRPPCSYPWELQPGTSMFQPLNLATLRILDLLQQMNGAMRIHLSAVPFLVCHPSPWSGVDARPMFARLPLTPSLCCCWVGCWATCLPHRLRRPCWPQLKRPVFPLLCGCLLAHNIEMHVIIPTLMRFCSLYNSHCFCKH